MKKLILLMMIFAGIMVGQELNATVKVHLDNLPSKTRDRLVKFESVVSDYLNRNKFSDINWEFPKINCRFEIFMTGGSDNMNYTAQVVITSQRPINESQSVSLMFTTMDNTWEFVYEPNQTFYYDSYSFNSLTSFLDYYALLIIGLDMDSYGPDPHGGSSSFAKALDIAVRGGSSAYSDAWISKSSAYNKRRLVDELNNATYNEFRADVMDYHFNGLDLYAQDKKVAHRNIVKLVNHLTAKKSKVDQRSVLLKVFFDAKAGEIVKYLKDYPDKSVFSKLKRINPANTSKWDQGLGLK